MFKVGISRTFVKNPKLKLNYRAYIYFNIHNSVALLQFVWGGSFLDILLFCN